MAEDVDLPTLPTPGVVIGGRYLLGERVAQGGMGAIYAATDQRLGRKVAVKMMLDVAAKVSGFAERFEREAKAASAINHPSCVVVHDYGVDEHGTYLVLEWVDGRTLAALVKEEGPLKPERAVELIAQVCEGLSAAHAHGIIHRDVKPENVMVTPTPGGDERAKLVDFGIARPVDGGGGGDASLTGVGVTLGTPMFMSPEQAMAMPLDARSDVYSTAATLYFALSGRQPYVGDRMGVFRQVVNAEPPDLPPALYDHPLAPVLKRAMAKDRAARPQTAAELARELRDAVGAGRGVVSLPRVGRRALAVAAAVVVAAAAAISATELLRKKPAGKYPEIEALLEANRPADADDAITERLRANPDDPELQLLRGHARAGKSDEAGARAAYLAAVKGRPEYAADPTLQKNALEWLKRPNPESALELWRAVGKPGLPALRSISASPDRNLRWNAIRLRQQIGDDEPPDLVAAYVLDLEAARDCGVLRTAAERLRDAKDARGLAPLKAARARLNFIDSICAGGTLDDAIRALESAAQ